MAVMIDDKPEAMPLFWENAMTPQEWIMNKTYMRQNAYTPHVAALDVETSTAGGASWVYLWCFAIDDFIVYGRTVSDLVHWMRRLSQYMDLRTDFRLVTYIHNAKYDLQFFKNLISLESRKQADFIARSRRQIIRCCMDVCYEMRDSAVYTETPLSMVGAEIGMQKYETDHTEIYTPETPLPKEKIIYCARDVHILTTYFRIESYKYGSLADIPLTATQKVKRVISECFSSEERRTHNAVKWISANQLKTVHVSKKKAPTPAQLKRYERDQFVLNQLRTAFFGGFCYASGLWCDSDLTPEDGTGVISADLDACYASMMLTRRFPMGKFAPMPVPKTPEAESELIHGRGIYKDMALLIQVRLKNITARIPDFAFLPAWIKYQRRKGRGIKTPPRSSRIASADEIEIVLTDIDYRQLKKWYTGGEGGGNIKIISVLGTRYNWLPQYIMDAVIRLYHEKKSAKRHIKQLRAEGVATMADEIEYRARKTMLARMYGVFVQDPVRAIYEWSDEQHITKITRYSSTDTAQFGCVLYQWGVWVAAHAREKLLDMCGEIGTDIDADGLRVWSGLLCYADTDCVRWIDANPRALDVIQRDNEKTREKIARILTPGRIARIEREYHITIEPDTLIGCGEWEIERFSAYKQIGLKQYVYVDQNNQFQTVIAGLPRADYQTGADGQTVNRGMNYFDQFETNSEKMAAFSSDLIIPAENTKILRTDYFDEEREIDVVDVRGDVRHVVAPSGVNLIPTEYKARPDDADIPMIEIESVFLEYAKAGINVDMTVLDRILRPDPDG